MVASPEDASTCVRSAADANPLPDSRRIARALDDDDDDDDDDADDDAQRRRASRRARSCSATRPVWARARSAHVAAAT
jgi:hypothetical protein